MRIAPLALLFFLNACGSLTQPSQEERTGDGERTALNPLEQGAINVGLVTGDERLSPVGLYRQRHEAGRDSLCLLPRQAAKGGDALRFGLEASFGENIDCHGSGTARLSGNRLVMDFDGSSCVIVAQYEGDRVALPGTLDTQCRKLCTERGSLEGVSFPRVSREASVAAAARAGDNQSLCGA